MVVIPDMLILALSDSYGILHAAQGEDSIDSKFWILLAQTQATLTKSHLN